ncbi:MAG: PQQ-dependent sugar dehydrogenase [Thermomicrobiales bacterium]
MRIPVPLTMAVLLLVMALASIAGPDHAVFGMQNATPAAAPQPQTDTTARLGGTIPGDPQIQLVLVADGFRIPTHVALPPDDSGRIFVVELDGRVKIVTPDGQIAPEPFLDLSSVVSGRPGQQGLLGLAFHPQFAENGKFYVDYNDLYDNGAITISEFTIDPQNPNRADPKSERPLMTIPKPSPLHNGGTLRFGPDGYLYISTGDGGWQGDAWDLAQNRFSLLGKILRIDVDRVGPGQPYGIPADNPFAGYWRSDNPYPGQPPTPAAGERDTKQERKQRRNWPGAVSADYRNSLPPVRAEIWALGFRNPWQFAFDSKTGDFYVGDVGADTWEEIDFQAAGTHAGQNYGWDWLEASHCFPAEITECPRQQVGVLPVAEYQHGIEGCAVVAFGVARGKEDPALDGIFFSGDFCTGEIRGLVRDEAGVWQFANMLDTALQITASGEDGEGNLYVATITGELDDSTPGAIWKLMSADRVPAGAKTAPLGEPRQIHSAISEEGEYTGEEVDATSLEQRATPVAQPTTEAAASPAAVAATTNLPTETIGLYDIYFEPRRFVIPANTDVRVVLINRGQAPHSFALRDQKITVAVPPQTTSEVILNLPAGTYKFICDVPGHKQVGMNGAIIAR